MTRHGSARLLIGGAAESSIESARIIKAVFTIDAETLFAAFR